MAGAGFRDYVEAVRDAADIVEVVGDSVTLRKAGNSLVGLCPFHQEKTPSFRVDRDKGLYYCFGCQAGGDVFSFVKTLHGMEFPEAVRLIGDRYGIPRPAARSPQEDRAERSRRTALKLIAAAHEFYRERLYSDEGRAGIEYLGRRGISRQDAELLGLGYAPAAWDRLLRHLSARGAEPAAVADAGLTVRRRQGDGYYDRFRNRLLFPIRDSAGRVVSFGGRALGEEDPKYLNGPETSVYDKGRTLYRLSECASEIRSSGRAVVVEGYFDAAGLAAAGIPGVVAVCGTALGPGHASLLRRYAERVVLLFDGDRAGRHAVRRALGPLLAAGLGVRVAAPPDGLDPDDLVRESGVEAVRTLVESASDLPSFLVEQARLEHDLDSLEGRVAALEMVLEHVAALESRLARAEAIARVAEGLGVEDELVRDELRRAARERRQKLGSETLARAARPAAARRLSEAEQGLIRFLFAADGSDAEQVAVQIEIEDLGGLAREIVVRWIEERSNGRRPELARLAESARADDRAAILELALSDAPGPDAEQARGCIRSLSERRLRRRMREVQQKIEQSRDQDEAARLLSEKLTLARRIDELSGDRPEARTT
jgi:DNA primase